jgi:hypothetical protein
MIYNLFTKDKKKKIIKALKVLTKKINKKLKIKLIKKTVINQYSQMKI